MAKTEIVEAQNPLILRCNRLIEAFSKSDDERDFYLDRREGYIVYVDLDKPTEDLEQLEKQLKKNPDNFCMIPKMTFYESKKIMEGFINEKIYDIDTKEKLLDIIQSKEARENFLEFIHDHHSEQEKWQAYYQERSRIRIIEWLRTNGFNFVFEEDLEIPKSVLEKVKKELFNTKAQKDIVNARKTLIAKAKTYYSSEALNPRPKRGRPPKLAVKAEVEQQAGLDIYTTVPQGIRAFLFVPDLSSGSGATFSTRFGTDDDHHLHPHRKHSHEMNLTLENLNTKLQQLRSLTTKWKDGEQNINKILDGVPPKPAEAVHERTAAPLNGFSNGAKKSRPSKVITETLHDEPKPKSIPKINVAKNNASHKIQTTKQQNKRKTP